MKLLELDGTKVIPSPECLQLSAFRDIWERDKSKSKKRAKAELAFVFFYSSFQSDFANILDDKDREREVIKLLPEFTELDQEIRKACYIYEERQETVSSELLKSAKIGVKKIKEFFDDVDLTKVDKNGKPVHDAEKLRRTIDGISNTVKSLSELESLVLREIETKSEMKGGRAKSLFEDGI